MPGFMNVSKLSTEAAVKTHGLQDASAVDVLNPIGPPLDGSTGQLVRAATTALIGWVGRGYAINGTFSLK